MISKRRALLLLLLLFPVVTYAITSNFGVSLKIEAPISIRLGESWKSTNGRWNAGHLGEDLLAPPDTKVYASASGEVVMVKRWPLCDITEENDGKVTVVESDHGWGGVVVLKHTLDVGYFNVGDSYVSDGTDLQPSVVYTQYGHVKDILVEKGEIVNKGDQIASIGKMCKWIPHLHMEVKTEEGYNNDINNSAGAGFGYSGTDGHAPHRYKPSRFIELNKNIVPEEPASAPAPVLTQKPQSFFDKIKSFFSNLFAEDPESASTEEETQVETGDVEEQVEEVQEEAVYNVAFLPASFPLHIIPAQTEAKVIVFAKNTGNTTWQKHNTSLNVVGGTLQNQKFHHASWLTQLRPAAMIESTVAPGDVASFAFTLTVPGDMSDVFRLQLVRQAGGQFFQIGNSLATISFQEATKDVLEEPEIPLEEETFFDQLEEIQEVLGEKIGEVFEDIANLVPTVFKHVGGGSSNNTSDDTPEESTEPVDEEGEEEEDEVEIAPEIVIISPTSSLAFFTTPTTTITGTYNESVSSITLNNSSTVALSSSTWSYDAVLLENTTTTFTFVGWNASSTVSSSAVSVSFVYTPEESDSPEISITSPTTSPYTVTTTPVVVSGIFNTTTSYLTVNNATSSAFSMNSSTNEWDISLTNIAEEVTTTYSFLGWSEEGASSTPVSIDILYEPEIVALLESPTILTPTQSSTYTTSSITFAISGAAPTGTVSVVLDQLGTTTTVPVVGNQWTTSMRYPGLGIYTLTVYGQDAEGVASATTTIAFTLVRELDYKGNGLVALSEIAWMGTEASANDEWFEIMSVTPDTPPVGDPEDETEPIHVVWGSYDSVAGEYEHTQTLDSAAVEALSQIGPPILIFDEPGIYLPIHPSVVFERTDQSTLPNANGLVYTGALSNAGERMLVLSDDNTILDDVDMSAGWAAGDNDTKDTMIRTDLYSASWCTYSSCPSTEYIGDQIITDADGNLVKGSPYSPYQILIPEL